MRGRASSGASSPCLSIASGWRPSSSAPSRSRATPSPRPSSARPSRSSSPAATCSPAPRPAPARRPRSSCRSSSGCTPPGAAGGGPRRPIRALVLAPTRELALQVEESVRTYGAQRPVRSTAIYGGVGFEPQVRALRAGPEIVVATPGRLLDHVGQRTIDLSRVEILVLDEADRMLDMGFIHDIRKVLALLPAAAPEPALLGDLLGRDPRARRGVPERPGIGPGHAAEHGGRARRAASSSRSTASASASCSATSSRPAAIDQALVFTRTKHGANRLAEQLVRDGIAARDPRQQEPAAARPRARRLQGRPVRDPRRDRHRGARARHRGAAPRRQLRAADGPRGLRPPHRPHRPRRASTATPSRWSASTRTRCCATSSACSGAASRREVVPGFEPDRASAPSPSSVAGSVAHVRAPGRASLARSIRVMRRASASRTWRVRASHSPVVR